jgi:hypothetical protein
MLTQGNLESDTRVLLGHFDRGQHRVMVTLDSANSAKNIGSVRVTRIDVATIGERDQLYEAVAHAPILHARPNTIGHFTDVPLLMWYETATTPRGRSYRYSVIFSNEDGGTATDRLMATWGRTTDIEFVYGIEVDAAGRTLAEEFQGPSHVVTPFRGAHEALHPLEFVVTDNNMVSDRPGGSGGSRRSGGSDRSSGSGASGRPGGSGLGGPRHVRYAVAPEPFDLTNRSREVVMDAHAWTYRVSSQEMLREGKIADDARAGSGKIPDPRRFVFVEACSDLENAALSFGVRTSGGGPPAWYDSDRGRDDFRIVRSGCFRGAVPLPPGAPPPDAIRFKAWPAANTAGKPAHVRVTRVNGVFVLADGYLPQPSRFSWTGSIELRVDGSPSVLPF